MKGNLEEASKTLKLPLRRFSRVLSCFWPCLSFTFKKVIYLVEGYAEKFNVLQ